MSVCTWQGGTSPECLLPPPKAPPTKPSVPSGHVAVALTHPLPLANRGPWLHGTLGRGRSLGLFLKSQFLFSKYTLRE